MTIITIRLTIPSKCKGTFFEGFFSETVYYSKKVSPCERLQELKDRNSERKRMHLNALTTSYSLNPIQFHF